MVANTQTIARRAPRFEVGRIVATPGVVELIVAGVVDPAALLARHQTGDWGDLCAEDHRANERALLFGGRLLSAYIVAEGVKVWVITESDRAATTLLLPDEY